MYVLCRTGLIYLWTAYRDLLGRKRFSFFESKVLLFRVLINLNTTKSFPKIERGLWVTLY